MGFFVGFWSFICCKVRLITLDCQQICTYRVKNPLVPLHLPHPLRLSTHPTESAESPQIRRFFERAYRRCRGRTSSFPTVELHIYIEQNCHRNEKRDMRFSQLDPALQI